jgi:hypothetical protein
MPRLVTPGLEDPVEPGHAQENAVGQRQRAARQRGAGAARHDLDALVVAVPEDARDLVDGLGQHGDQRPLPVGGQPVALVGGEFVAVGDHPLAGHDRAQRPGNLVPAREHRGVGFRHFHRHIPPRTVPAAGPHRAGAAG